MKDEDGAWVDLMSRSANDFLDSSFSLTSGDLKTGIKEGTAYTFRIRSSNRWGFAESFSPILKADVELVIVESGSSNFSKTLLFVALGALLIVLCFICCVFVSRR